MNASSFPTIAHAALLLLLTPLALGASPSGPADSAIPVTCEASTPALRQSELSEPMTEGALDLASEAVLVQLSDQAQATLAQAVLPCLLFAPERLERQFRSIAKPSPRPAPQYYAMR